MRSPFTGSHGPVITWSASSVPTAGAGRRQPGSTWRRVGGTSGRRGPGPRPRFALRSVQRLAPIPNRGLAGNLPDSRWPGTLKRVGPLTGGDSTMPGRGGSGSERWFPLMDRPRWKRPLIVTVKAAVAVLVLWAVGRHVLRTWNDLRQQEATFQVQPVWLIASGVLYLAGLSCCGRFYERVLAGQPHADRPGAGAASLPGQPPGQVRAGQGDGRGDARGDVRALRRPGGDGGDRHLLRDAGDDGGRRPGRRRSGSRWRGASPPLAVDLPVLGHQVGCELYHLAAVLGLALGLAFLVVVLAAGLPPARRSLVSLPFPEGGPGGHAPVLRRAPVRGLSLVGGGLGASGREPARGGPRASPPGRGPVPRASLPVVIGQRGAGDGGRVRRRGPARRAWGCARACSCRRWLPRWGTRPGGRRRAGAAAGLGGRRAARRGGLAAAGCPVSPGPEPRAGSRSSPP